MQLNNLPGMISGMPLTQSNLILLNSIYAYVGAHSSAELDKLFSYSAYDTLEIKISTSKTAIIAFSNSSQTVAPTCFSIDDYSFKTVWDISALLASFIVQGFVYTEMTIEFSNGHVHDLTDYIGFTINALAVQLAKDAGYSISADVPLVLMPDTPLSANFYSEEQLNLTLDSDGGTFNVGAQFTSIHSYTLSVIDEEDYSFDVDGVLTYPSGQAGSTYDITVQVDGDGSVFTFPIHITFEDLE